MPILSYVLISKSFFLHTLRITLSLTVAILLCAVLLARHNFRQGRGDRRGAFRLALFVFACRMFSWLLGASHEPTTVEVGIFFFVTLSQGLLAAGFLWLLYFAVEPYVRRHWPDSIISWSRVLSGGLRDPLVGRDLLVGVLFGIALTLFGYWSGVTLKGGPLASLTDMRSLTAVGFLTGIVWALPTVLAVFFLVLLLRIFTRRPWLAACIYVLIWVVQNSLLESNIPLKAQLLASLLFHSLIIVAFFRFGLLTTIIFYFVSELFQKVLLTTHFSAWYGGHTLAVLLAVLALAGYAFHTSLGGQKLFTRNLLEE